MRGFCDDGGVAAACEAYIRPHMRTVAIIVAGNFTAAALLANPASAASPPSRDGAAQSDASPSTGPVLSRQSPVGLTVEAPADGGHPPWKLETSELCRLYRSPALDLEVARRGRVANAESDAHPAARASAERKALLAERNIRREAVRELVSRGLSIDPRNGMTTERKAALEALASLRHPAELEDATEVLSGEGFRKDLLASDGDVRTALFGALATDPWYGQARLVRFGVAAREVVAASARDALPAVLSQRALNALRVSLAGQREETINRAAMIAGAHPAGSLIPSLIQAQFEESAPAPQGDEAWIAIGKSTAYVAGLVPVVGNGSGAFQPIPGVVYEGSVLRIMESAVTIYRTEVHQALVATVEQTTGQPAPPLGFDKDRWMAWYANQYPQLAQAYAREHAEQSIAEGVRTSPARSDG